MIRISLNQTILLACQQGKSPCIIALDNSGSKAPIQLSERRRSCLARAKPSMLELGIAPKENFLAYSTQFIFLIIRLAPGNVVMVAIDMCGKSPSRGNGGGEGSGYMELSENMFYLLCFLFIYLFVCLFNNIFTFRYLQCLIRVS